MSDLTPEDFTGDAEVLQEFAADLNVNTRIEQSGMATVITTKLDRDLLVDYLRRLADDLATKIDTNDGSDMVAAIQQDMPNGDSVWAAILRVNVW